MTNFHPPLSALPMGSLLALICLEILAKIRRAPLPNSIRHSLLYFHTALLIAAYYSGHWSANTKAAKNSKLTQEAIYLHQNTGKLCLITLSLCALFGITASIAKNNKQLFSYLYYLMLTIYLVLLSICSHKGGALIFELGIGIPGQ